MTSSMVKTALHPIVQKYGLAKVLRSLAELADGHDGTARRSLAASMNNEDGHEQRKQRVTAPDYVKRMELSPEIAAGIAELADRFHLKAFLPTLGDVAAFCEAYQIELPASKTRANAIPRIFKFIAGMEPKEIQTILDYDLFSGPSRLGPIAEAIRNHHREVVRPSGERLSDYPHTIERDQR